MTTRALEILGAWLLGLIWILPLAYAVWTAIHPAAYATHFDLFAPLTIHNFAQAWDAAPFARYFLNTTILVTLILAAQFLICTPAAFAFARMEFPGRDTIFAIVLMQLMVMPDVLLVGNYRTMVNLGLVDTILAIALPYLGSAFGIFLLRQTFRTIPLQLDDAARLEGCTLLARLWRVYVPLAKPTYIAYTVRDYKDGPETKSSWTRIGSAWPIKSGKGFSIVLDALPIDGRITLHEPKELEDVVAQ